jgi:hypothetical protein
LPCEQKLHFEEDELTDEKSYRELVGSLVYAMTCTRPDLCWIVTMLSQFLNRPNKKHWIASEHVLRYIKGTLNYELTYN